MTNFLQISPNNNLLNHSKDIKERASKNVMNSIAEMEQLDIQFNSLDQKPVRPFV